MNFFKRWKHKQKPNQLSKSKILDSWIMVEHLSEGDFKAKGFRCLDTIQSGNYHSYFKSMLAKTNDLGKEAMLGLYIDIFPFLDILRFLRDKYHLETPIEELKVGEKFALGLYFDKDLNFSADNFFFTVSGYIKYFKQVPSNEDFKKFEKLENEKIANHFEDANEDPIKFNLAIKEVLARYNVDSANCFVKIHKNIESDAVHLHSFFIDDLERAKSLNTVNLKSYLYGSSDKRINLDPSINPDIFKKILAPTNYPYGRFPSKTKYAPVFMQQVAINLSIGFDDKQMRSVNGPPGTGKTTLLRDIIAELVVKQAYDICNLKKKRIDGGIDTMYDGKNSIGILPQTIADNNIVVASTNNAAVQNIVNELPLLDEIDDDLREDILSANYFTSIANTTFGGKDKESNDELELENLIIKSHHDNKYWGLFSFEGGKSSNMKNLITAIEHVYNDLLNEYTSDLENDIYKSFMDDYRKIKIHKSQVANNKISITNPLNMNVDYDTLQLSNSWYDEDFRIAQSKLFIKALKVRKDFLYHNRKNIKASLQIWQNQNTYIDNKSIIEAAWHWINFCIPVISSTFASFSRMCANIRKDALGHLFIDEAGQALPQAAIGAIYRSRHVMVVGDPSQIKPVLTLDNGILKMIGSHYEVDETYLSENASTQTLVDRASQYGFLKDLGDDKLWIGIPLWVHRRCSHPMFDISNRLSYNNLMVLSKLSEYGKSGWYDITGKANDKFVQEQADFLAYKIKKLAEDNPKILDHNENDTIFVITPFKNVADKLSKELEKINFTRKPDGKVTNVGTIHTFQGKEAPIVFLVLGADNKSKGAASWAVCEPNMMNVAATRAKEEFYIIGDKSLYAGIGSDVAEDTIHILRSYKKSHPELVDEEVISVESLSLYEDSNNDESVSPIRLSGIVTHVDNKGSGMFAYVKTSDVESYAISEKICRNTKNASDFIKEGSEITFIPQEVISNTKKKYAIDIKPA